MSCSTIQRKWQILSQPLSNIFMRDKLSRPLLKRKLCMEYYFSGTIERVILKIKVVFSVSYCWISMIQMQRTMITLKLSSLERWQISSKEKIIPSGEKLVHHPKYGQQLQMNRYERAKPTSKGLVKYFSSDHFKGSDSKRPKRSSISMVRIPLIKFCKHLKS